MRLFILITGFVLINTTVFAQTNWNKISESEKIETDSINKFQIITENDSDFLRPMHNDEIIICRMTIEGLKEIRHDSFCRLKFYYAHYLKLEIRKEEIELNNLIAKPF